MIGGSSLVQRFECAIGGNSRQEALWGWQSQDSANRRTTLMAPILCVTPAPKQVVTHLQRIITFSLQTRKKWAIVAGSKMNHELEISVRRCLARKSHSLG